MEIYNYESVCVNCRRSAGDLAKCLRIKIGSVWYKKLLQYIEISDAFNVKSTVEFIQD